MLNALVMIALFLTSVFLILLVLIQRGRGGGLAGAFGGLGGQSAFGTKAGDLFTRITIGVAATWIILCAASVKLLNEGSRSVLSPNLGGSRSAAPEAAGGTPKAAESKAVPAAESKAPAEGAPAAGDTPANSAPSEKAK